MTNQSAIELYSTINEIFEKLSNNFDNLYPNKGTEITLKKKGVIIRIDYKDFKKKK